MIYRGIPLPGKLLLYSDRKNSPALRVRERTTQCACIYIKPRFLTRFIVSLLVLIKWPHPGSTKQRSESERCIDYDREDANSVLDCTMSLDVDGDSGDSDSVMLKQERKARLPVMAVVNHKNLGGLINIHDLDKTMHRKVNELGDCC